MSKLMSIASVKIDEVIGGEYYTYVRNLKDRLDGVFEYCKTVELDDDEVIELDDIKELIGRLKTKLEECGSNILYCDKETWDKDRLLDGYQKVLKARIANHYTLYDFSFMKLFEFRYFRKEVIDKTVHFNNTVFEGETFFDKTVFEGTASFMFATFKDKVHFANAKFKKSAFFDKTVFKDDVSFRFAEFKGTVFFYKAVFAKVEFNYATFEKNVNFFNNCFNGKVFHKEVVFKEDCTLLKKVCRFLDFLFMNWRVYQFLNKRITYGKSKK